jgi:DNA-binding IclR family transcriptional regulator
VNISTDELLDAIQNALGPVGGEDAWTVGDLCEKTGFGRTKVTSVLKALSREGRIEVTRTRRMGIDQRMASVPAYRLRP